MLLNLILLILFIIILISNTNIIEGQEGQGDNVPPASGTTPPKDTLFHVMNFFPKLFKNELVLYEKKHNDDRKEVYLSSFFESKGLYNGSEEEKEPNKVTSQPGIKAECIDSTINKKDSFITAMVEKYQKQNISDDSSILKSKSKDLNFDLFGADMNFNLNDSASNKPTNNNNSTDEYHNICELPFILYDKNASITDRVQINASYGNCFNVNSRMYSECRKSCYEATSSRTEGSPYIHSCSGFLVGDGVTDDPAKNNCNYVLGGSSINASMLLNNDHYIKHRGGYYTQCIPNGIDTNAVNGSSPEHIEASYIDHMEYKEIPCRPAVCRGEKINDCAAVTSESFYEMEHECNNKYYTLTHPDTPPHLTNHLNYQCIMEKGKCVNNQHEPDAHIQDCVPENKHPAKDYNMCYKESSKFVEPNKDDTDYIVTLF